MNCTVTIRLTDPAVHVTLAIPGAVLDIKVAVAVPLSSVVTVVNSVKPLENVPSVVVKVADVPMETGWPFISSIVAVIIEELIPLAGIDAGTAVSIMVAGAPVVPPVNCTIVF